MLFYEMLLPASCDVMYLFHFIRMCYLCSHFSVAICYFHGLIHEQQCFGVTKAVVVFAEDNC